MNSEVRLEIEDWLKSIKLPRASKAVVSSKADQYVVGGGVFLGVDQSEPNASPFEIFSEARNLPTAVASILGWLQKSAHYYPGLIEEKTTPAEFDLYVKALHDCPFLSWTDTDSKEGQVSSKNYDSLINSIAEVYDGAVSGQLEKLTTSVENMAKNVFSQEQAYQTEDLFSQNGIIMASESKSKIPIVTIAFTRLHMETSKDGKSSASSQSFIVKRTTFNVLDSKIHAYASSLSSQSTQDIDEWLASMDTSDDTTSIPCITQSLRATLSNSREKDCAMT